MRPCPSEAPQLGSALNTAQASHDRIKGNKPSALSITEQSKFKGKKNHSGFGLQAFFRGFSQNRFS